MTPWSSPADAVQLLLEEADRLNYWRPRAGVSWDVWHVALRRADLTLGPWSDRLCIVWWADGRWWLRIDEGTTMPGLDGAGGDLHPDGVAMQCAGQTRGAWVLGVHGQGRRSAHRALVQRMPIPVWRDAVGDGRFDDFTGPWSNGAGINLHGPWRDGLDAVGSASLGCSVRRYMADHRHAVAVSERQIARRPTWRTFTRTLFTQLGLGDEPSSPEVSHLWALPTGVTMAAG